MACLDVSTDMQDVNNQKLGVIEYCAEQKLGIPNMVSDTISGKVDWQQREIGKLLMHYKQLRGVLDQACSMRLRTATPAAASVR